MILGCLSSSLPQRNYFVSGLPRILCSTNFVDTFTARLAYKKLIRMNMPVDEEGKVNFTTTLFALIRENLSIKMRSAEEMDQVSCDWWRLVT